MHQLLRNTRLWLLRHRLYGLRHAAELRMEVLVPFTDIATSVADLAAAPMLTKKQRMHKHYCAHQLSQRTVHLEHARRAQQKLTALERRHAEFQATV